MYIRNYIPIACTLRGGTKEGFPACCEQVTEKQSPGSGGSAQHCYEEPQGKSATGTVRELCANVLTQRQPHATNTKGWRYYSRLY